MAVSRIKNGLKKRRPAGYAGIYHTVKARHTWLRRFSYFLIVAVITFVAVSAGAAFLPSVRDSLHRGWLVMAGKPESADIQGAVLHGAASGQKVFKDVEISSPLNNPLFYLKQHGIIKGFDDGTFRPSDSMTRAEFIVLIGKIKNSMPHPYLNRGCFKDVADEWFAKYVCSAKRRGIVSGTDKNYFSPDENVSQAGVIKIMLVAFGHSADEVKVEDGSPWYEPYLVIAQRRGWLWDGFNDGDLEKSVTRGQVADMLFKVVSSGGAL